MSFIDPRNRRVPVGQEASPMPESWHGSSPEFPPVTQLPFPGQEQPADAASQVAPSWYPSAPPVTQTLGNPTTDPGATQDLPNPPTTDLPEITNWPAVTRALPELQTGMLVPLSRSTTSSLRGPVVIRGSGKKSKGLAIPPRPKGKRTTVHHIVTGFLVFMLLVTFLAVVPTGNGGDTIIEKFLGFGKGSTSSHGSNSADKIAAMATATAVTQDGYDPGPGGGYGLPPAPPGSTDGGLGRFFYGQCTYWANKRYHDLTGQWVTWLGNANQWASGAMNNHWVVSDTPHLPAIIVLQAYVQGSSYYGHVAIVEKINPDGTVLTSNYNWRGAWATLTYVTFSPGSGVKFIWFPGK